MPKVLGKIMEEKWEGVLAEEREEIVTEGSKMGVAKMWEDIVKEVWIGIAAEVQLRSS